ncbi:UNVERIFIED_CONTAM: hypothetical protein RMT77_017717 [Armadillidium vulgare]
MEFARTSLRNIKRTLLIFTIITIFCSTSIAQLPQCKPGLTCTGATVNRFRTIDGTCNNLARPHCGASEIPFVRWLPRSPSGSDFRCPFCPRPRDVSFKITNTAPTDHTDNITLMVMQWGQFTDHDCVFTPEETDDSNCCEDFQDATETSACKPIDVRGDSFYSSFTPTINCLPFVRSRAATCQVGSDPVGPDRQNINDRTAYLDGSAIYGSTQAIADSLRTFSNGTLKIGPGSETLNCSGAANVCPRTFLPIGSTPPEFFAGDARVEEQPGLTSIHTVFLRLHNFLASFINCGDDELTYQTVRKIIGALIQQITYSEFLPIVLGPNFMNRHGLTLNRATTSFNTFNNAYDQNICASAPSVFATAAFRFGHSLIPDQYNTVSGPVLLERNFNNHDVTLNPNSFPSHFLHAIVTQRAMPMDHRFAQAITNKLFAQGPNFNVGSDLIARNTKRGRDHGIPGYVEWFNACENGLFITDFPDLEEIMPLNVVDAFRMLYRNGNVEDIDLFPAGAAEFEVPGGLVGPTFACIIARHFQNLKFGDRFWFERQGFFSLGQVQSLRRTKLSSIICTFTAVDASRRNVMRLSNPIEDCSLILEEGLLYDIYATNIWKDICSS